MKRLTKTMAERAVTGGLARVLGRERLARLSRFINNTARLDLTNDMATNGETMVQRVVLERAPTNMPIVIVDVGANLGNWIRSLVAQGQAGGRRDVFVHAFEPCSATFAMLRTGTYGLPSDRLKFVNKGCSSQVGSAQIYVVGAGAGTNSLHNGSDISDGPTEDVELTTIDAYCRDHGIPHVTMVKVDTEGHDLSVIEGAIPMLSRAAIDVLQFEYNWRWVLSRHYLRDVFDLIAALPYRLGKVTRFGVEFYDAWHPELESFREGNYLVTTHAWASQFPSIRWWNESANQKRAK